MIARNYYRIGFYFFPNGVVVLKRADFVSKDLGGKTVRKT